MTGIALFFVVALTFVLAGVVSRLRAHRREAYIRSFELPRGLFDQLRKRRPELQQKDCQLVAHALRTFFLAYLKSGRLYVSMPSQAADDLWHEFILFTRNYEVFCSRAFGRFLHHTPAVAVSEDRKASEGLQRTWWHACKEDHINPRLPARLPLLFALDAKLGVAGGFVYALDCKTAKLARGGDSTSNSVVYCGGDMASSSSCGGGSGGDFGGGGSGGGDGNSSGDGGCGGGGCGGGGD
jgi:hypothetical protein